jgi:hypothetical protein
LNLESEVQPEPFNDHKEVAMSCRTRVIASVLTAAWMSLPSTAGAQDRQGLWVGAGGGWGSANVTTDELGAFGRENGGAFSVRLGGTLNPRLLLGGEFDIWSRTVEIEEGANVTANIYNLSGTATFYPRPSSGFFVKGGAGLSFVDVTIDADGESVTFDLGKGPGFVAGAGYDIRLSRRVSLTPAVDYWYGRPGDVKALGETLGGWKQNVVAATLGITFH